MAQYHRSEASGAQVTSMRDPLGSPITMNFLSLKADLQALRSQGAPLGIVNSQTSVGQTEQGKDIQVIRIGKDESFPVLIVGCHHAREWISVEVPYLFAKFLIDTYPNDPVIRRIVDSMDLWIVPMVNPDGHEQTVLANRFWRKNSPPSGSGRDAVDLNRNYATAQWNISVGDFSDDPSSDTFRGQNAAYAKEVNVMQNLILDRINNNKPLFQGLYDFHSYGRWILYPWFGRTDPPPNPLLREAALQVERMVDAKGEADGKDYVEAEGSKLYIHDTPNPPEQGRIPGDFGDFNIEKQPQALVLGIELEPADKDPRQFVIPESEIEPTFQLHKSGILTFLNCLTTLRNPPDRKRMLLQDGSNNSFVVFQPDGWRPFLLY